MKKAETKQHSMPNRDEVARVALSRSKDLVPQWIPGGNLDGNEYRVRNPTRHDEHIGSFSINLSTGRWADFSTGDKGGDLISLYAYLKVIGYGQAIRELADLLGIKYGPGRQPKPMPKKQGKKNSVNDQDPWRVIVPIPPTAPPPPESHIKLGTPSMGWKYLNERGELVGYVVRFETKNGKTTRPLTYWQNTETDECKWHWKTWPLPRFLFGLHRLAQNPQFPVLVVEGEKTACAAQTIFPHHVAITSPNGSKSAKKADWTPLCGREIFIWPDADEPGKQYARDAAAMAYRAGVPKVYLVNVPADFPKGWDLADDPPEGWTVDMLRALIENAILLSPEEALEGSPQKGESETQGHPAAGTHEENLPQIIITGKQLSEKTSMSLEALKRNNDPPQLFVREGALCRIRKNERNEPSIDVLNESAVRGILARSACWYKENERGGLTDISPPMDVVRDVLALGDLDFPPLISIIETPIIRPDGSLCSEAGYDPKTHLLYLPPVDFQLPLMPEVPTQKEAILSMQWVFEEIFSDFPFEDEFSYANLLGCLISPMLRHTILGNVPLALIDAPQAGTGKSLLATVIALLSTGREVPMTTAPEGQKGSDEEEWRKRITSSLILGNTIILIDNVDGTLKAPSLASVLTADIWADRILGRSKIVKVPNKATWIVTGNNLRLGGDLPRRCYWIRLDAKMARPWQGRRFKHSDLIAWVSRNRGQIIGHLLCVIRAWFMAGRPEGHGPVLGSFENWCRTVGGILEFAGVMGFLGNLEQLYEEADDEGIQWMAFAEAWHGCFGENAITLSRLVDDLNKYRDESVQDKDLCQKLAVLRESIPDWLSESYAKSAASFKKMLGRALSRKQGAHLANGFVFEKDGQDSHTKAVLWKITCKREDCGVWSPQQKCIQHYDITSDLSGVAEFAESNSGPAEKRFPSPSPYVNERSEINEGSGEPNSANSAEAENGTEYQHVNVAEFETAPHTVTCAACDHYDGLRWCRNEISWNGARGQSRDLEHACEFFKGA